MSFEELKEELARCICGLIMPRSARYRIRSGAERANARLKDEFGTRLGVRGHVKIFSRLMFGVLALTGDRLMHLAAPS